MLRVPPLIEIPSSELNFTYARSSGPGGQNVNKVNSKAVLRWNPGSSQGMPGPVRERFLARFAKRLTTEGELVLSSDRHRDQGKNARDCIEKLREMLQAVAFPPKKRKATRPTRSSVRRRREEKTRRGEIKKQRGAVRD